MLAYNYHLYIFSDKLHVFCVRFFNRLYSEYQQLLEVKRLQLEASNPEYDASLLEQVNVFIKAK